MEGNENGPTGEAEKTKPRSDKLEIVKVLVKNGQPVEYGQGLFAIRTR